MKEPVIYWIKNRLNGKFYVGSTTQRYVRWRTHKTKLRANTHHCRHLQAAWNNYGEHSFEFSVIEKVLCENDLQAAEDRWLIKHVGKPHCYNAGRRSGAPMRGRTGDTHPNFGRSMSQEQRDKLRKAAKKQWKNSDPRTGTCHSEETKALISKKVQAAVAEGRGGKFIPTAETRAKMSEALKGNQSAKGYKRTEAEKAAIRQRTLGNKNFLGKTHSEESKAKMGQAVRMISPEGEVTVYPRTTALKEQFGIFLPTIQRSVRSGKPLSKGPYKGWRFEYV